MNSMHNIADAGVYTDFSGLQKLRAKVSGQNDGVQSQAATKEVAQQFEALFLQMMLKSMREATISGDSTESDQTRFYQGMFDKQIALELVNSGGGGGLGIADMLERDMVGKQQKPEEKPLAGDFELIQKQINRSTSSIQTSFIGNQE